MEIFTTIIIEFLLVVSSILFLFKLRDKLGLAPLYILLGAVQYVLALSGPMVSFNIYENITIYPASVILFSAVLFAVLLIYIKEGVVSARTLIIGIIISNFIISALFSIIYTQETISQNLAVQRPSVYAINYKYFITGTLILLLDFILLVIIYQFLILKKRNIHFFLIIFISLFSVLIFDATVFNFVLKYKSASFSESLIGHVIGKSVSSFIFSVILYLYLKFIEKETNHASFLANQYRDIFSILRYRKKIIDLQEEKKQVEQKLTSQLETSLNNISDGFVSLDTNWCYTYVNKKAGELLRRSPKSLIGKHIWTEFPEGVGRAFYKAYYKAVETQKTIYFEDYYKPFDRWFENRIYPSSDGLTIYFTDITDKKKAEIELEKHRNNLEELVASRTSDLEKEKVKAQSADLMKSAFLATMSHELRTPMNSIIGFTGILLKEFAGPLNEEQKKQITMVKTSGEHLLKLINDVLDISKIEAGKLKVSKYPFNYVSILENTIEFLRPQVIKKDLKIKLECAETRIILNSDERRLEQVLLNLIANAIKFSEQGTIEVKVAVDDKFLITQVIDQGIGISNEEQNKLFTPFIQLENGLTRRHEGTGLGLAICKNIIEKLGGTIQVKSKKGEGSNFTFIIPIENNEN